MPKEEGRDSRKLLNDIVAYYPLGEEYAHPVLLWRNTVQPCFVSLLHVNVVQCEEHFYYMEDLCFEVSSITI